MPGALFASFAIWQQVREGEMDRAVQRPQRFVVLHAGHNFIAAPQYQCLVQIGLAAADVGLHTGRAFVDTGAAAGIRAENCPSPCRQL